MQGMRTQNGIANNLAISKNIMRSHRQAIYTKFDVRTRQELLDYSIAEE